MNVWNTLLNIADSNMNSSLPSICLSSLKLFNMQFDALEREMAEMKRQARTNHRKHFDYRNGDTQMIVLDRK